MHNDGEHFASLAIDFEPSQIVAIEKSGAAALLEAFPLDGLDMEPRAKLGPLDPNSKEDEQESDESSSESDSESSSDNGKQKLFNYHFINFHCRFSKQQHAVDSGRKKDDAKYVFIFLVILLNEINIIPQRYQKKRAKW